MADIRIGSGPQGPLLPAPRPSRVNPGLFVVIAAAVVLVAAAVATGAYLMGRTDAKAQVLVSDSPAVVQLTEDVVCRSLWPDLIEAQEQVTALVAHPDMSTVDKAEVEASIVGIEALTAGAPQDMRRDMAAQVEVLKQMRDTLTSGENRVIDMEAFRSSGIRLGTLCSRYAS